MPLRIVFDARHLNDFGIGTYIRNLLGGLGSIDRENRYFVVCLPAQRPLLPPLPNNFRCVPYRRTDAETADHIAFPAFLRRLTADLHHIPLNRVPWFMPMPYVVTVHDMSRQLLAGTGWRNQMSLYRARRGLLRASRVIAVSGATRRNAENVMGIPHEKIRRIYNAPDPRFYDVPSPEEMEARDRERIRVLERYQVTYPFVLYAGNIRPQKNLPRLIEAFAVLCGELVDHPRFSHLRLIVIGDEISQYPAVRRAAAQSRAGQAIRFLGYVPFETLRAFYESAEVFAFPSLHEGFGLPPLEAMACGTPVVTSNVSSLPEVVGDAAIKVSPDNVFEIARGLKDVLLDGQLRQDLVDKGLVQAHKFSWERTARQVLDTYLEVARGKTSGSTSV